jgi:hypothetical protein
MVTASASTVASSSSQPGPFLRRLAKQTFDTYVPPHVQRRERRLPTRADLQAAFRQHIHMPGLTIRHWARHYTLQVRVQGG